MTIAAATTLNGWTGMTPIEEREQIPGGQDGEFSAMEHDEARSGLKGA